MFINKFNQLIISIAILMLVVTVAQAENCELIKFSNDQSTTIVESVISPDEILCYEIETVIGKKVAIEIEGANVMFSIENVVDAQEEYQFIAEKDTHRIIVSQLMQSVVEEPFTLIISIKER